VAERRGLVATLLAVRHTLAVAATNLNQLAKVANATGEVSPGHPQTVAKVVGAAETAVG
jgi:hypothetical protein